MIERLNLTYEYREQKKTVEHIFVEKNIRRFFFVLYIKIIATQKQIVKLKMSYKL
mgnify:CR=1 FL=1